MRKTISRSSRLAVVMVGAAIAPTIVQAQDTTGTARTHVVRKGDTLWDLARRYLSDPYQWPEIYKLNAERVADPHWIYPGAALRLPGAGGQDATLVARPTTAEEGTGGVERDADVSRPSVFAVEPRSGRGAMPPGAGAGRGAQTSARAVRVHEVISAPYIDRVGGPVGAGRVIGSSEVPGIPLTEADRRLTLEERIFVELPLGRAPVAGDRYVVVASGPVLEALGQVLIPAGVVAVESAQPGKPAAARVVAQFGELLIGQRLVPLEATVPAAAATPAPVANGAAARVAWIAGDAVFATLQHYVILDAGSAAGIRAGDQVTLHRAARELPGGPALPEAETGVAQVIRVTAQASTAIIIRQSQAAISVGSPARVTATLP